MIDFKVGDFGSVRNICGDSNPCQVVSRDGDTIVVEGVDYTLKSTTQRVLGSSIGFNDVERTETKGNPTTFVKDVKRGVWRTELYHRKGRKITKRTNPRDLDYVVLHQGFCSYYNPHI